MRKFIPYVMLALLLTSCSTSLPFFKQDATPTVENQAAQAQIVLDMFDSTKALVTNATGLEPLKKQELLAKIEAEVTKYKSLVGKQLGYLESLGDVQWQKLIKDGYSLYKEIKEAVK